MCCAFLQWSDGHFDENERVIVYEFLQANYEGEFDVEAELQLLHALNGKGLVQRLTEAAHYIDNSTSMESKLKLLKFSIELIAADGKITENEYGLFAIVAEIWGVDLDRYLNTKSS